VPKQFCRFGADMSLLQQTIARTAPWIPAERVTVVVTGDQHGIAAQQLAPFGGAALLVQPRSRGTGPAALLAALAVHERDPEATMVLTPCDQAFTNPAQLLATLAHACSAARVLDRVVLVGAEADAPCSDYGWIVAEPPRDEVPSRVDLFVEKPTRERAEELFRAGALWSTLILAARTSTFLHLYAELQPELLARLSASCASFARDCRARSAALSRAYQARELVDLSRDVLAHARDVHVCRLPRTAGWIDLGDEERLARWLAYARARAPGSAESARKCRSFSSR
jgi:mannose-1-phosphate guanylyltransferase